MAYRRRRGGRRGRYSLSRQMRGYMVGLIFLAFAMFIVTTITYLTNVIPANYIYVNSTAIGVGTTIPSGATGISTKLVVGLLGWSASIIIFITALNRLKVRL